MAWLGLEFRTPDSKSIHFPLHHLIVYGVEKWGEREGDGFPLINCHSFPGYFVRKTCPGEKEFLLLLLRDWEGDTPSLLGRGILWPFSLAATCSRGARTRDRPWRGSDKAWEPLRPAYLPHPGCKRPPLSWLCTGLLPPQVKASGPP